MGSRLHIAIVLALLPWQPPGSSWAQQATEEEPAVEAPPQPSDQPQPGPTPDSRLAPVPAEPETLSFQDDLECEFVVCRCDSADAGFDDLSGCEAVVCRCVHDPPPSRPMVVTERQGEAISTSQEPLRSSEDRRTLAPADEEIPRALRIPVPSAGFQLSERRAALHIDVGSPFLDVSVRFRLHDVVQLGLGYRGVYGASNGGYAALRFRLYRNTNSTRGLSLMIAGGYLYDDSRDFDFMTGANGPYGDVLLATSFRKAQHALDVLVGIRLGWIRGQWCESNCWDAVFEDGEAGLLPTVILALGWSVRISPSVSYTFACGVNIYTTSRRHPAALPLWRNDFVFDF